MAILDIISLACALVGVPGSIYAIKLIRDDWAKDPTRSAARSAAVAAELHMALAQPDEERILLKFDKGNTNVPGSFENAVREFVTAYPVKDENNYLIYNPLGFIAANEFNRWFMTVLELMALAGTVLLWAAVGIESAVVSPSRVPERGWLDTSLSILPILAVTFAFAAAAYLLHRVAGRYRAARDAAQAYLDYLRTHEIRVQHEFTQSKRMNDFDRASTSRRGLSPQS